MTGITIYNVQRVVTPKAGDSELCVLCSAHHIMVIYICIKFQENILNSFQATEWTHILQTSLVSSSKGHNSKSRLSRCTVCMFCTSSHDVLHLYEVLSKYLKQFFVCVEVLWPSQPNGVMSSAVSLPNHTFTGQA